MDDVLYEIMDKYRVTYPAWSDCPQGWEDILESLVSDLIAMGWNKQVSQVKEKYGGLRFYIGRYDTEDIRARIHEAGRQSVETCQYCGTSGEHRQDRWWRTTCDPCESGLGYSGNQD